MIPFITTALSFVKTNRTLLLVIAGFLLISLQQCANNRDLRKQIAVANHNINALNDTIRVTKDRQDRDEYNKLALLTDKLSNLEKLNADLVKEVKAVKGKVSTIITGEVVVKEVEKPVPFLVKGELVDSTITTNFAFDTIYNPGNWRKIKGFTKYNLRNGVADGQLTQSDFGMKFTTGIKNLDKGKPEIFLKSDYPGFSVTALDGAVLDPKLFQKSKTKLITTGVNIGWTPVTYDVGTKQLDFNFKRFGVTAGVNINILKLLRR